MFARPKGSLALGLLLVAALSSAASAKPRIAILGLEVIGTLDPEQAKLAKQLTNALRERAGAGTGPYQLAANSDKELADEKLMNNCENEALSCMAPIGLALRADYLMFGKMEKVDKGFHVTIKLIRVATKTPLPTFSEIVSISDLKNDPKAVAKRAYALMTASDDGTVTVRVANVDRAVVYLDDQPMGTTASGVLSIPVPEGKHRLAVVANEKGFARYDAELSINAGDRRNIPVELARVSEGTRAVTPREAGPTGGGTGATAASSREGMGVVSGGGGGGGGSGRGGGGWTGLAIGGAIATVASAGGFAWSWYELSQIGKAPGDKRGWFLAYSCTEGEAACQRGQRFEKLAYVTGIGAVVLGGFTVYAFYKGASQRERSVAGGRSTRARRTLTVTPVASAQGGGATLRFDW